jgi:branched-chain amino acid transport system permease protein
MAYFTQQLINAITLGAIYGLIAIGYTMVYGIIGMINFAHGEVFMIGAFISLIGFVICGSLGISSAPIAIVLVLLLAMSFSAVYGWAIERTAYRPLRGSFRLAPLISAIGVSIALQNYVQLAQGARPKPGGQVVSGGFNLFTADGFDVRVTWLQIIIVLVTVVLMAGFTWVIAKTSLGRQQRACELDMKMAALLGVNVDRTISLTFALGSALAAAGGVLFGLDQTKIEPMMGVLIGLKAFVAAVLGGIGNIPGAMLGGLLIGMVEQLASAYLSSSFAPAIVFSILVVVLLVRPQGLLGRVTREKV